MSEPIPAERDIIAGAVVAQAYRIKPKKSKVRRFMTEARNEIGESDTGFHVYFQIEPKCYDNEKYDVIWVRVERDYWQDIEATLHKVAKRCGLKPVEVG